MLGHGRSFSNSESKMELLWEEVAVDVVVDEEEYFLRLAVRACLRLEKEKSSRAAKLPHC